MAIYIPPTEILPIFDSSVFNVVPTDQSTTHDLLTGFLLVKATTGTETFSALNLSNLVASSASIISTVVDSTINCGSVLSNDKTITVDGEIETMDLTTASYIDLGTNSPNVNTVTINGFHKFTNTTGTCFLGANTTLTNASIGCAGGFLCQGTLTTNSVKAQQTSGNVLNGTGTANISNLVPTPVTVSSTVVSTAMYPRCVARGSFYYNSTTSTVVLGQATMFGISSIIRSSVGVYILNFTTPQTVSLNYEVMVNIIGVGTVQLACLSSAYASTSFKMTIASANNTMVLTDPTVSPGVFFTVQYYP